MILHTKNYRELIPPTNAAYPWVKNNWQLLCYYCSEPIHFITGSAGYRQRGTGHWAHIGETARCNPNKIRPDLEIDDARCNTCATQTVEHDRFCSAGGKPIPSATPMSVKENELIRIFGWI